MSNLLSKAFDPDDFQKQGYQLVDQLSAYLRKMQSADPEGCVLNYVPPDQLYERWENDLQQIPHADPSGFFQSILHDTIHMHHPKYLGHQTSVVAPLSALSELIGGLLDPGMGVYEQGTSGVALERVIAKKLAGLAGWGPEADGFLTSGGTLGNLTALLCARQAMIDDDVWEHGYRGRQYAFMVSAEAHYSVSRAIRVMGMGSRGVVTVPVDEHYRMDAECLGQHLRNAKSQGIEVIGVVASSCATATGSYDPIDEIADFCETNKLWLHVDGAHGGCVLFSRQYRHLLKGLERADSFIVDFHKMLLTPKLITAVIFSEGRQSYQTFAQKASYLWEEDGGREWFNLARRTFELTKSFMSIRVYALWRTYGTALFEENVERLYGLGKTFARLLAAQSDFEMVTEEPDANIVCYRYVGADWSEEKTELCNARIRKAIVEEGVFFIVQAKVQGRLFLRSAIMNPFTTEREFQLLIEKIRAIGRKMHLEAPDVEINRS